MRRANHKEVTVLVLSRKPGQIIRINDDIIVKVFGVSNGIVKVGVSAPDGVRILREEVYQKNQGGNSDEVDNSLGSV